MKRIAKTLSFTLSLVLCLTVILSTLLAGGVQVAFAADVSRELWLLADTNHALKNGTRVTLSETADLSPYQNETGTMYMPVSILCDYTGATYTIAGNSCLITLSSSELVHIELGSAEWTVDGEEKEDFLIPVTEKGDMPFVSILMAKDIFGLYNYYDKSMGLVILSKKSVTGYSTSYSSVKSQINTLSGLIMDRPTTDTISSDLVEQGPLDTHPRLLIDEERFDELRLIYTTASVADTFGKAVSAQVSAGSSAFNTYFKTNLFGEVEWKSEEARESLRQPYYLYDENGNRLVGKTSYTYVDPDTQETVTLKLENASGYGDGYDVGGRSNVGKFTEKLKSMAFAWQITGEEKYVDAFYLFALELDKWEHWGEGHFLNVADGAYAFAIGFDWIYHGFDDEPEKRAEIADILYRKGLMKGYYSAKYDSYNYRTLQSLVPDFSVSLRASQSGWRTLNRDNNWQTVCGAGMIVSALALSEYDEYRENCLYVINKYIGSVEKCLLQYAPDGSYPESPGYWAYGTNTLMNTLVAMENCLGTSYGYKDIVGFYESYYYAAGIADSDYKMWNYHDSSQGNIDTSYFYVAAKVFDDDNLAKYRNNMIFNRGVSMTLMDVLFYDSSIVSTDFDMPLDANYRGIYTATFRSSWSDNATYTGLHVGPSHVTHGDFDTGNFILSMDGVDWCIDPGTEDYNVNGFWSTGNGGTRYKLYRKSLEGHSSIIIHSSSLVHGQVYSTVSNSFPTINTFYSDENGGYAISNMTSQYGSTCTSAKRGVLMTNSRRTVVLQDEISFNSPTSLTWVLNLQGEILISDDGKTIISNYWENGIKHTMRVTMLTDDESLSFRRLGRYETVLSNTITKENSGQELACDPEQRVVIEANNVTDFNVGVVFDILKHPDEVVGYEKVNMSEWTTCNDDWINEANSGIEYPTPTPKFKYNASHFAKANSRLSTAIESMNWVEVASIIEETSIYLTDFDIDDNNVYQLYRQYLLFVQRYNLEVDKINQEFEDIFFSNLPSSDAFGG